MLEYGEAVLEMHLDAVAPGDRVLIVDDVIATGGTLLATASVLRRSWGRGRRRGGPARDRGAGRPGAPRRPRPARPAAGVMAGPLSLEVVDAQEERFAAAFGAGDISVAQRLYRPDVVLRQPDHAAVRMAGAHRRARPDARVHPAHDHRAVRGVLRRRGAGADRRCRRGLRPGAIRLRDAGDAAPLDLRRRVPLPRRPHRPAGAVLRPQRELERLPRCRDRGRAAPSSSCDRPGLYRDAPYAYAALAPAGRLVFSAGACPLDGDGVVVGPLVIVETQARQTVANLLDALDVRGRMRRERCSRRRCTWSRRRPGRTGPGVGGGEGGLRAVGSTEHAARGGCAGLHRSARGDRGRRSGASAERAGPVSVASSRLSIGIAS